MLYAATATLFWSTSATAFKLSLRIYPSIPQLLFHAAVSSWIILSVALWMRKRPPVQLLRGNLTKSMLLGLLNPFLYYLILFKAYDLLPGQEALPLNYTWPIALIVLSALIQKKKLLRKDMLCIFLSFIGILIIGTRGHLISMRFSNPAGAALAIGSSLFWAAYWLLNQTDSLDPVERLWGNFTMSLIYLGLYVSLFDTWFLPDYKQLFGSFWIGCFEMGVTFILWRSALAHTSRIARISNIVYLSPFLSLLFLQGVLGEQIRLPSFIGLCLIVGSLLIQNRVRESRSSNS